MESSFGEGVRAFSEMIHHASLLREFHEPIMGKSPGMFSFGACESLFTYLENKFPKIDAL